MLIECLKDALIDSLKLLPFLFIIYILIELLEHKTGDRIKAVIKKTDRLGPLFGGLLGAVPQCGLSTAAATLYTERLISIGTLLAIFLSTSDEMLPLLISGAAAPLSILKILGAKILISVATGYVIDLFFRYVLKKKHEDEEIHTENHQHEMNLFLAAILHTLQVFVYLFVITLVLNVAISLIGEESLTHFLTGRPVLGVLLSSIVGLVPNCGASVLITKLYLDGMMEAGAMFAGLLVNAGVGTLVLFRTRTSRHEVLTILGLLFASGLIWGLLIQWTGLTF